MGLQTYFEKFNKSIKMDYDELSELAEKRDILIKKLRNNENIPSFNEINQGSYSMYTGVKPLGDKDYDIDVGLRFNANKADYKDPLELKKIIRDVLKNHTEYGAKIKNPCVTVTYKKDGEISYHIDLVTYIYEDKDDKNSQLYLARGKEFAQEENKYWEKTDPIELKDKINNKFEDEDARGQYRRVIRYLKRWKNIKFDSEGNSEPPGIGITLLAYEKFQPQEYDSIQQKYICDDLNALIDLVNSIKNMFCYVGYSIDRKELLYRIKLNLPVEPYADVFEKMTDIQMTEFKNKIDALLNDLKDVRNEAELVEQCTMLRKIFGDDFEVPAKEETAVSQSYNRFVPSSSSGKEE